MNLLNFVGNSVGNFVVALSGLGAILFAGYKVEQTGRRYYNTRVNNNKTNPKVYDVFHRILPDYYQYNYINHILTFAFLSPMVLSLPLLSEFISFAIPVFLIRAVMNNLTILPKHKECPDTHGLKLVNGCYDKIFSGHFAAVLLACLLYVKHGYLSIPMAFVACAVNALVILAVRGHYTNDIVVAFFVVLCVYQNNLAI
jgi:hypothetical protein